MVVVEGPIFAKRPARRLARQCRPNQDPKISEHHYRLLDDRRFQIESQPIDWINRYVQKKNKLVGSYFKLANLVVTDAMISLFTMMKLN